MKTIQTIKTVTKDKVTFEENPGSFSLELFPLVEVGQQWEVEYQSFHIWSPILNTELLHITSKPQA